MVHKEDARLVKADAEKHSEPAAGKDIEKVEGKKHNHADKALNKKEGPSGDHHGDLKASPGKEKTAYIIFGVVIALIIIVFISQFMFGQSGGGTSNGGAKYDALAKCLTEKGAVMYGAYWCPHCQNNKKDFGSSVQYITYVECAVQGSNEQVQACEDAGITGYPTWVIGGQQYQGEQAPETLASLTGCSIS